MGRGANTKHRLLHPLVLDESCTPQVLDELGVSCPGTEPGQAEGSFEEATESHCGGGK